MVHPSQRQPRFLLKKPAWSLTLRHGKRARTFAIRPLFAGSLLTLFLFFFCAYVGATAYLVYRDDLLGTAVSRQVRMQYSYEERIAALRAELDRLTSRHAVQTEGVEEQLSALLEQQALIERHQSTLDALLDKARGAGVNVAATAATRMPRARPADAEPDASDAASDSAAAGDSVGPLSYLPRNESADDPIGQTLIKQTDGAEAKNIRPILAHVGTELDGMQAQQSDALDALNVVAENEADRISAALTPLGVDVGNDADSQGPEGGPFIPMTGLHFVERAAILKRTLSDIQSLRQAAAVIPLAVPVVATRISSGFGYRVDPFLKRPAFHSGIDFVASAGTTVHATAPGRVSIAGWDGGYGQMVEIQHADGISTRYGHLSAILVSVGDTVAAGDPIGRVGTTGRSTGPHLHYETRRDGEAVNPTAYLAAGKALRQGS